MIASVMLSNLPCGIIFEGEKNQFVAEISSELHKLGLFRSQTADIFTPELCEALNVFRHSNLLPESEYCDPITLRLLTGIDSSGEDLLLLARWCSSEHSDAAEVECFDLCRSAIHESRILGITIHQYLSGKCSIGKLLKAPAAPAEVVKAAVLASILES